MTAILEQVDVFLKNPSLSHKFLDHAEAWSQEGSFGKVTRKPGRGRWTFPPMVFPRWFSPGEGVEGGELRKRRDAIW